MNSNGTFIRITEITLKGLVFGLGLTLLLAASSVISSQTAQANETNPVAPVRNSIRHLAGSLPSPSPSGSFIENQGQFQEEVKYYSRTSAGSVYLTSEGFFWGLAAGDRTQAEPPGSVSIAPLWLKFEDIDPSLTIHGLGQPSTNISEYLGADATQWKRNLPAYSQILYSRLYPGIDLVVQGLNAKAPTELGLKGTYILEPGADPSMIRWRYSDDWDLEVGSNGDLLLNFISASGSTVKVQLVEKAPVAWQVDKAGNEVPVPAQYRLYPDGTMGFSIDRYNPSSQLIIDPELEFSTFLGGSGTDEGFDIAIDGARNPVVVGATISVDYPTDLPPNELLTGNRNILLTKLSNDGLSVEFSLFLGGSGDDLGRSVSIDSTGEIYLTGSTASEDFPSTIPADLPEDSGQDIFVVKLSLTGGQMRYSRLFGGSGIDEALGITADNTGSAFIVGTTASTDFPMFDPFQPVPGGGDSDGFVMKLNALGNEIIYSSYLGGDGEDGAHGVAVDRRGAALITGVTASENFPTRAGTDGGEIIQSSLSGNQDAFLIKLTADGGGHVFSTYLGEGDGNRGNDITLDRDGNAYIVGTVDSLEGEESAGSSEAFVIGVGADAASILFRRRIGGSGDEEGLGIGLDRDRNIYITGETESDDLSTTGIIQPGYGGNGDAFISQLDSAGGLVTTHYLGGSEYDSGRAIAVTGNGDAFSAGVTFSRDFPTVNSFQSTYRGEGDVFITKIGEVEFIPTPVPTDTPEPPPPPPPPTATPTAMQDFAQSDLFLYLLAGAIAVVVLLIILDFIIGRIRRWLKKRKNKDKTDRFF